MSEFSFQQANEGDRTVLSLAGPINESTKFPQVEVSGSNGLVIDLDGVTYINSIGIKLWVQWITPLAESTKIEFRRCPKSIIFQINMVKSFLPEGASVSSFYLPLFCEACDSEKAALVNIGSDILVNDGRVIVKADLPNCVGCTKDDCEVEVDIIEKKYFRFLLNE